MEIQQQKIYGYLRVSTGKQDTSNNINEILRFANEKQLINSNIIWIEETVSGRKDWRKRKLGEYFEKMNSGDTLIMSEYSRIGRNMYQSVEFIAECRRKKINIYSTVGDIPQTDSATDCLLLSIKAYMSQIERDNISYRTKIKLQSLKEQGFQLGRHRRMILDGIDNSETEKHSNEIKSLINHGVKLKVIATRFKTSTITLRKFIKKYNLQESKKLENIEKNKEISKTEK